ncbi:hypothetical protein GW17_00017914 [Ensete ventricosum]|nr:hypothetical protein GW17_00017914 [Ensete ventricosum]RZS05586.1 hypothetical protein BHM03_00036126 [Ensete ventricosum]
MKTPRELRDQAKYYRFYLDNSHDKEECHDLNNKIEELIHKEYLKHNVKRPRESPPYPHGLIEKQINVIIGGSTSDGDSALRQKAYA